VFIDIDPDTYNIDTDALAQWFSDNPDKAKKVKAIIPVHLYGQCADMKSILALAEKYSVAVIEDAAQATGSKYEINGSVKTAGTLGTMGCYSFFPSKNLGAMGDGGMVVTDDEMLAKKIRKLMNHGANPKYYHAMIGGNFRLDAIQAAVLEIKLNYLDGWHKARQKNAAYYDEHLSGADIHVPTVAYDRTYHIYNQYVISVSEKRDALRQHLTDHGIGSEIYYPVPFHMQECFAELGYAKGDFPQSEYAAEHTIALPIYPELTQYMLDYVIETIKAFG